jgi:hypothetical protein
MVIRRRSIALAVASAVVLLAAGCSSPASSGHPAATASRTATTPAAAHSTPAAAGPVAWSKAQVTGFPAADLPLIVDSLNVGGRWYIVVQTSDGSDVEDHVLSSGDGVNWKDVSPPLYTGANGGELGAPQDLLATDGSNVYLIGSSDVGLDVWTDGVGGFDSTIGNGYEYYSDQGNFLPVGIVSSHGCVYWAVAVFQQGGVADGTPVLGAAVERVDVWSYCNGSVAANPAALSYDVSDDVNWTDFKLTADSAGPVLLARGNEYRLFGAQLQKTRAIPADPMLTVTNGSTVVAAEVASANLGGQGVGQLWSSAGASVSPSRLPVGELPDAGVAPEAGQTVASGCSEGKGFVLAGFTSPNQNEAVGAVWTSPDGQSWSKMPVKQNELDQFSEILGVGCSPDGILLLGIYPGEKPGNITVHSWKGQVTP